jgi:hypothetical protein
VTTSASDRRHTGQRRSLASAFSIVILPAFFVIASWSLAMSR